VTVESGTTLMLKSGTLIFGTLTLSNHSTLSKWVNNAEPTLTITNSVYLNNADFIVLGNDGSTNTTKILSSSSIIGTLGSLSIAPYNGVCYTLQPNQNQFSSSLNVLSVTWHTTSAKCPTSPTTPSALSPSTVPVGPPSVGPPSVGPPSVGPSSLNPGSNNNLSNQSTAPSPVAWIVPVVIILIILIILAILFGRRATRERILSSCSGDGGSSTAAKGALEQANMNLQPNRSTNTRGTMEIPAPPFRVTAVADYMAVDTTQMSITKGVLYDVTRVDEGQHWFQSKMPNGKLGWFPASYARIEADA